MALSSLRAELVDLRLRPDLDPYGFVAGDDFIASGRQIRAADDAWVADAIAGALPYAVDWKGRRMLFTMHRAKDFARDHAFLYQAQRAQARQGIWLPFDVLHSLFPAPPATATAQPPTFLFSVGRCGSTLAADLLDAAGIASASEPGVYEQLVQGHRWSWLHRRDRACVIRATTHALCAFLGAPLVVKLRAQCTMVAQEITQASQGRSVMILRALEPWARSTWRAFGKWPDNGPDELAWRYAQAIRVFDSLTRKGSKPQMVWYEDMVREPAALLRAVGSANALSQAQRQALEATYGRDSQRGLDIGRSGSRATMAPEAMRDFKCRWARQAPHRLLARYGIADRV